jgi:hypothetical protein
MAGKVRYLDGMSDLLDPISDLLDSMSDRLAPDSDHPDPIVDLIRRHDAEIVSAEAWITSLNQQILTMRRLLADLVRERSALEAMAEREGVKAPPASGPVCPEGPAWTELSRVQAVQQALVEASGPLHLVEIEAVLRSRGRSNDDVALISATLAYLKRRRGSVASVGGGRWETTLVLPADPAVPAKLPQPVPSISDI